MYSPIKDGIDKAARTVQYVQAKPPADISTMVDCFWELKTYSPLAVDFELHALPDACVNILFNQLDTQIAWRVARQSYGDCRQLCWYCLSW